MKSKLHSIYFILLLSFPNLAFALGGDLGGGVAAIKETVRLDENQKALYQQIANDEVAYKLWIESLNIETEQKLLKIIFKHHVATQIEK